MEDKEKEGAQDKDDFELTRPQVEVLSEPCESCSA